MSRTAKGARLYWRKESRKADGNIRNYAGWFIRDGDKIIGVGGSETDRSQAEKALGAYIVSKHQPSRERNRDPDQILIADVINVYLEDKVAKTARPQEAAARLDVVLDFFGEMTLDKVNGKLCRDFASSRPSMPAARRQLEDLRAAINHYHKEGFVTMAPAIVLPEKSGPRERWLTREEAAAMLRAAWRMRQSWKGEESDRRTAQHIARFLLVALYTGTRSGAVCGAAIRPTPGQGFVDLDRGVFFRKAAGAKVTKKRQPPVRLPDRLVAHMRRWATTEVTVKTKGRGKSRTIGRMISHDHVVEWQGRPVVSIKKGFRQVVEKAGLGWYEKTPQGQIFKTDVTPHTLRHTAATWLMRAGTDVWEAAGFLGMTPETLINTYGHHHPDFQADAAQKITSKPVARSPKNVQRLADVQKRNETNVPHSYPTAIGETNENIRDLA